MPIRESEKARYPKNWSEIRARILARAGYRCEECRVPNYAWIFRDETRKWHYAGYRALRDAGYDRPPFTIATQIGLIRVIKIVLTVAHLDHEPENCADDNLKALCQYDHLMHDQKYHRINAARTRHARNGNLELLF